MSLRRLRLTDFRIFADAELEPDPDGTTVITGPNGTGKTSFLEAVAYLGTQRSFRTTAREAMIRAGADRAILRADLDHDGLPLLVEAELAPGRSRTQVNRQLARTRRETAAAVPVTVFSPEDLAVVQGGPARRRDLLDDALRLLDHRTAATLDEVDRVLRQRAALLRQAGGRLSTEVRTTLEVWDDRLATAGSAVATAREQLLAELQPLVAGSYAALAGGGGVPSPSAGPGGPAGAPAAAVRIAYRRSWSGPLGEALRSARQDDLRRGVTTVGPHRDDLDLGLGGRDARTQASQGEQRCVALALRLGVHRLVTDRSGSAPILLLDDVFSELDPDRSRALVRQLPAGQALLTTAVPLPGGVEVASVVDVRTTGHRTGTSASASTGSVAPAPALPGPVEDDR
ncbi:MAG TPA: DNA replication and repair protein RecF [Acidimicrobiales bacterium]|nr:DNA replication and repair protein RecF [Acidimicrobiales bacterium]